MAGNEKRVAEYLVLNKGKILLKHLGLVTSIGAPDPDGRGSIPLDSISAVNRVLATEDSRKKADVYINGHGVSIKQTGASNLFNRLQRANLIGVFTSLAFDNPPSILNRLDVEVENFHNGRIEGRNRHWQDFFNENAFKSLLKYLMMEGSPNVQISAHPAEYILEAPSRNISGTNINVFMFDEYFDTYKSMLKIAIRRSWYGQTSESEHKRASGLMRKPENATWVFDDVAGEPAVHESGTRWRADVLPVDRKTVYFLMIEKTV